MKWYHLAPLVLQKLFWFPSRFILVVFGHLRVKGIENLKGITSNVIFSVNHSSEIDPFLVPSSLPIYSRFSPLFYPVREKKFYDESGWRKHLFGGRFINMWGGYPVFVGLHDYEKSLSMHLRVIREGGSMCVFPEGKISSDGKMGEAKGGIAYLAERTRCTIIPVGVSGVFRTKPSEFFTGRRHITVNFGKPITIEELRRNVFDRLSPGDHAYREAAAYVAQKMTELIEKRQPVEVAEDRVPQVGY